MTPQAQNSISLYMGQDPGKILALLSMQKPSVVNELKEHFKAACLPELAFKLSRL